MILKNSFVYMFQPLITKALLVALVMWALALGIPVANAQSGLQGLENEEEAKAVYQDICLSEPKTTVSLDPGETELVLALKARRSEDSHLAICFAEGEFGFSIPMRSIRTALMFMSLRDFEKLWPHAESAWGNDLGHLRNHLASQLGHQSEYPFRRMLAGTTTRAIVKSKRLEALGKYSESYVQLRTALAWLTEERRFKRRSLDFDREMIYLSLGSVDYKTFGPGAAADRLKAAMISPAQGNDLPTNLRVNLAAFLAEAGRFAEALPLLDMANAEFENAPLGYDRYNVGGSQREFAWIYACIYDGLGWDHRAEPFVKIVENAIESPKDLYLDATKPSLEIKFRMYRCLNRPTEFFALFNQDNLGILSPVWLELQRASPRGGSLIALRDGWVVPEELQAEYDKIYRQLPESYVPALTTWRDEFEQIVWQ